MANGKKCFHLGILFMFISVAAGSRNLVWDSEGFSTSAGSKLRHLGEEQKPNSSNSSESNNKVGDLGVGGSQNKTEGSGISQKGKAENGTEILTPSRNGNNTVSKDGLSNSSSSGNSTEGLKHGGSQSSSGNNTRNGASSEKEKPKLPKSDELGTKKNDSGSQPEQNSATLDTKGSNNQTQNNDTVPHQTTAKKEIDPLPGEGHNGSSADTVTGGGKEKSGDKADEDANNRDSRNEPVCDEAHSCTAKNNIVVACLRVPGNGMQELSLLIQNKGEEAFDVYISAPAFLKIDPLNSTLVKEEKKLVHVSMIYPVPRNASLSKIVINVGDGKCILAVPNQYVNLSYKQRFFDGFSYAGIVTPMFGMYLLLFTVLAIGGSWICCKLRGKRRHGDGVRYQELEMNHPETNLSTNGEKLEAENIDGWDEWDDTWEDAEAGRLSTMPIQTVSSNGLASRRSNKDGWDNSWDD